MRGPMSYPFKTTPLAHQLATWEKTNRLKFYGLLLEMGTGKTKITIDTMAFMYDQGWLNGLLILGNKGSYLNWEDELKKHLPAHIKYDLAIWRSPMNKQDEACLDKVLHEKTMHMSVLLMNIEAISHERAFKVAYQFCLNHNTLGVMDESTNIKNPKAKRTLAAWKIRDACKARRILTGSAVDNRPLDAWAQFEFLRPGMLGYTSFYAFKSAYANLVKVRVRDNRKDVSKHTADGRREVTMVTGYRNLNALRDSLSKCATIIKKTDCLDLPPKIYQKYYVELTAEQKSYYEDMRKRSIIELSSSIVSTKIILTKLLRLQQIICGFVKDDDGTIHEIPSNRTDALMEILDESQDKGLIWANNRYSIQTIEAKIAKTYGSEKVRSYYGDTTRDERAEVKQLALRGTETPVDWVVSNPQSGGYGNTWTAFNLVVYYANGFDGELRNQSEDRAHRIGQTASVTYVDMIAKDTIDEKILTALQTKKDLSALITPSNWKAWF